MSIIANLSGQTALVTGASSGLGAHFSRVLAKSGAEVILCARRREPLDRLAQHIAAEGGKARVIPFDVTDAGAVRAAHHEAGRIRILVNNAGVTLTQPVLEVTEESWDWTLNTNLKGPFLVASEFARGMVKEGSGGSIINIASIVGIRQAGQVTPYAVAKAGLVQMTRQFALELARYQIRVNALVPGYFETELNRDFFSQPGGEALIKRVPMRRLGQLGDLDGSLLLLASDASSFMTGSTIEVDGGHLCSSL